MAQTFSSLNITWIRVKTHRHLILTQSIISQKEIWMKKDIYVSFHPKCHPEAKNWLLRSLRASGVCIHARRIRSDGRRRRGGGVLLRGGRGRHVSPTSCTCTTPGIALGSHFRPPPSSTKHLAQGASHKTPYSNPKNAKPRM